MNKLTMWFQCRVGLADGTVNFWLVVGHNRIHGVDPGMDRHLGRPIFSQDNIAATREGIRLQLLMWELGKDRAKRCKTVDVR